MPHVVVVGGSAGSIEALGTIVKGLPRNFEPAMLVVVHVPPTFPSQLPQILARTTALDVAHAREDERITGGTIRIAPPDHHLVVQDGTTHLGRTPRENRHRPSIDVLFRTAAKWYGDGVTAVVLSGGPGDGIVGLTDIGRAGGTILVQHPDDALFPALPESALAAVPAAHTATAHELGALLSNKSSWGGNGTAREPRREVLANMSGEQSMSGEGWTPSAYACPDCTGVLWERDDGRLVRFRCRIGHFFAPDALLDGKGDELESALWSAVNTMEERGELADNLASRARSLELSEVARRYAQTADDMTRQAEQIKDLLSTWPHFKLEGVAGPTQNRAVD